MRLQLRDWVDQHVFFSGRALEWEERGNNELWLLLKNVRAALHDPELSGEEMEASGIKLDHMWVILDAERQSTSHALERLKVFGCCGKPYRYERSDGSIDWAINAGEFINTDGAITEFTRHIRHKRIEHAIATVIALLDAWHEDGLPLCTATQSTNTVLGILNGYMAEFSRKGWLRDDRNMRRRYDRVVRRGKKSKKTKAANGFG